MDIQHDSAVSQKRFIHCHRSTKPTSATSRKSRNMPRNGTLQVSVTPVFDGSSRHGGGNVATQAPLQAENFRVLLDLQPTD